MYACHEEASLHKIGNNQTSQLAGRLEMVDAAGKKGALNLRSVLKYPVKVRPT